MARFVVFGGWFGSGNIGDDAILIGLRNVLTEAMPDTEIVAVSSDPDYTKRVCGVEAVPLISPLGRTRRSGSSFKIYFNVFRGSDACIVSGGTPIYDYGHISRGIHFCLPRALGKELFCFGIGVKPIRSRLGACFVRLLFHQASLVSVRDHPSRDELVKLGVDKPVEVTGDSALFLVPEKPTAGVNILTDCGVDTSKPMVAICPRALSTDHRPHYHEPLSVDKLCRIRRALTAVADRLTEDGYEVVFVPMHRAPYDDDLEEIRSITGLMRSQEYIVVDVDMLPGEAMALLGRMSLVIGLRLHSLIMAAAQGVPIVGVDYDPKILGFMELVGASDLLFQLHEPAESFIERAERAMDGGKAFGRRLKSSCEGVREKIEAETRQLASFLGSVTSRRHRPLGSLARRRRR